jgi:hypothetical protein
VLFSEKMKKNWRCVAERWFSGAYRFLYLNKQKRKQMKNLGYQKTKKLIFLFFYFAFFTASPCLIYKWDNKRMRKWRCQWKRGIIKEVFFIISEWMNELSFNLSKNGKM